MGGFLVRDIMMQNCNLVFARFSFALSLVGKVNPCLEDWSHNFDQNMQATLCTGLIGIASVLNSATFEAGRFNILLQTLRSILLSDLNLLRGDPFDSCQGSFSLLCA